MNLRSVIAAVRNAKAQSKGQVKALIEKAQGNDYKDKEKPEDEC